MILITIIKLISYLAKIWFFARMYAPMFLKVLRIDKCSCTYVTFVRSFASVGCFYMVIQQSSSFETFLTFVAFVTFIVIMRCSLVGLQIRSLTKYKNNNLNYCLRIIMVTTKTCITINHFEYLPKCRSTEFTLIRFFTCMGSLMITYFCFTCKCFATYSTYIGFISSMHYVVYFQIVR